MCLLKIIKSLTESFMSHICKKGLMKINLGNNEVPAFFLKNPVK